MLFSTDGQTMKDWELKKKKKLLSNVEELCSSFTLFAVVFKSFNALLSMVERT
jgi:hypothetical protein